MVENLTSPAILTGTAASPRVRKEKGKIYCWFFGQKRINKLGDPLGIQGSPVR